MPSAPIFVACCARSGSTLLRWLIDAHPEVSCPGETDLAVIASGYARIAADLTGEVDRGAAIRRARAMADELMAGYLERTGKSRWCDKSLSNVFHLEFLAEVWPEARFVLLHRHCMDFVSNGLEVSPWGLAEYGFAQVAEKSPTDSVLALAAYWVDRTSRLVAFEERHPARCLRLRYEDLVTDTDATLAGLVAFLGLSPIEDLATQAFAAEHSTFGAADHEIWYTNGIQTSSIGVGAGIPADHVQGPLRASVNQLLERLDYVAVTDDWGSGAGVPVTGASEPLEEPRRLVDLRVVDRHAVLARAIADLSTGAWSAAPSRPGATAADQERPAFVVAIDHTALEGFARGAANIGSALRNRTVRAYGPLPNNFRDEREVFERLRAVLADHAAELQQAVRSAAGAAPTTGVTLAR